MKTLFDYECHLARRIYQVTLLGELELTEELQQQLGRLIAKFVESYGARRRTIELLERNYPVSLAVYLVAQGVYGYQSGTFWPKVEETTGIPAARYSQFLSC